MSAVAHPLAPPVNDPLPKGGEIVSVECPLCQQDVELRVYTDFVWPRGAVISDVLLSDAPCGHDNHALVDQGGYLAAVQDLARAKWEDQ
jgi:hypothetical protein